MAMMQFTRTIGHEKQKRMFLRALEAGRLAHAYILAGPAHIGKTTFALDLAEILEAHPVMDVALFDSPEGLTVEGARDLQSRLSLMPSGKHRVAIISDASRMNSSAANSLLKTLEEPPEHSVIFLVTENYHGLLPTVASRAQRVNFSAEDGRRIGLEKRMKESLELREFYADAARNYGVLEKGALAERLLAAQQMYDFFDEDLRRFLDYAMRQSASGGEIPKHSRKLLSAWEDLSFNANVKLMLDNLFV